MLETPKSYNDKNINNKNNSDNDNHSANDNDNDNDNAHGIGCMYSALIQLMYVCNWGPDLTRISFNLAFGVH